jgi:hypothetical protein
MHLTSRQTLFFREATLVSIQKQLEDSIGSAINFRMVNNDTFEEMSVVPRVYQPNQVRGFVVKLNSWQNGYAFTADYNSPKVQGKWKILITNESRWVPVRKKKWFIRFDSQFEIVQESIKNVLDIGGLYSGNKYGQLFRKTIKVTEKTQSAIQLSASGVSLLFELFTNGEKTLECRALGECTLPSVIFFPNSKKDKVCQQNHALLTNAAARVHLHHSRVGGQ